MGLGRFLHDDPELAAHTRAALRQEEAHAPDVIHAEIAHHLQGLATNVNCRPVLRDYEIDVAGGSGAPAPRRLPLTDLLVSVKDGRIALRSRRHGRRVVPHLSSAHAFNLPGFPAYRFLAHLQDQGFSCDAGWSWGPALREAPFLPCVRYGKLVLSLASWRIPAARLDPVLALRGSGRFRAMQDLRAERKLPRFVRLTDGDNLLPVDLDNVLSIEKSMLGVCKRLPSVTCTEVFPEAHQLIARGRHGSFHHELVVPLLRAPASAPATSISWGRQHRATAGSRRPGDDWLYLQLYCGMATLDRVLVELVAPLIRELRADGAIKHWFFIRYDEGGWHMRLRLRGEARTLWTQVAPRTLAASSSMRGLVHRIALDTYDPEVERYGDGGARHRTGIRCR